MAEDPSKIDASAGEGDTEPSKLLQKLKSNISKNVQGKVDKFWHLCRVSLIMISSTFIFNHPQVKVQERRVVIQTRSTRPTSFTPATGFVATWKNILTPACLNKMFTKPTGSTVTTYIISL